MLNTSVQPPRLRVVAPPAAAQATVPDDKDPKKKAVEKVNMASAADGVLQDSTRSASLLYKGSRPGAKVMRVVADLVNGEKEPVNQAVSRGAAVVRLATGKVAPKAASGFARFVSPFLHAGGAALKFSGPAAQLLGVPFAALDVRDAVREHDTRKKNAAEVNAALSVAGTATGVASVFLAGSPLLLPAVMFSALTGGFQLLDKFALHDKGMDWLGEHVAAPLKRGLGFKA